MKYEFDYDRPQALASLKPVSSIVEVTTSMAVAGGRVYGDGVYSKGDSCCGFAYLPRAIVDWWEKHLGLSSTIGIPQELDSAFRKGYIDAFNLATYDQVTVLRTNAQLEE